MGDFDMLTKRLSQRSRVDLLLQYSGMRYVISKSILLGRSTHVQCESRAPSCWCVTAMANLDVGVGEGVGMKLS